MKQRAFRRGHRHDAHAWRADVGLRHEVERRRARGTEVGDGVVRHLVRATGGEGADREHPRCVAGRCDAAPLRGAGRVPPAVAGGGHDGNAAVHQRLGGQRQRVRVVRLGHRGADRQVHHADPVARAVFVDPIEGSQHVADRPLTLLVQHFERHERDARRHARVLPGRQGAGAAEDAGHGGAVPVLVGGHGPATDEIDGGAHARIGDVGVRIRGDAGIDDRHGHAGAGVRVELLRVDAVARVNRNGVGRVGRQGIVLPDVPVQVHAVRARVGGELRQARQRHAVQDIGVDDGELAVVRIAPERGGQIGALLEHDDQVGGCGAMGAGRAPGQLGVHLAVVHKRVARPGSDFRGGLLVSAVSTGRRYEAEGEGRKNKGSNGVPGRPSRGPGWRHVNDRFQ